MLYFAYGSNMSPKRLLQRVPSAVVVGIAILPGHRLAFHKVGRDGSAKCDASFTDAVADRVHGVIYRIDSRHKARLDAKEGLGHGYEQKTVEVQLLDQRTSSAFLYYATHVDASLRPFTWYREHVLHGARAHTLPGHYIAAIQAVEAVDDPDPQRHWLEMAIYG
ncbi:MAG: gamma-glutamylcyclotransferase [Chromatiaceae bacterium]|jgi:cation transport regulator ChaC